MQMSLRDVKASRPECPGNNQVVCRPLVEIPRPARSGDDDAMYRSFNSSDRPRSRNFARVPTLEGNSDVER